MHVMIVIVMHVELVCFSTKERKQAGLVPRRGLVDLEPGFDQVLGIERVRVIEPYASGIGPPVLITR